jgi:glycosyltransferase involved in cell wall biosynthesis
VLWLIKGLGRGGAEQLLVSLARAIDRSDIELEVAYILPHKSQLVPDLSAAAGRIHCLGGHRLGWVWALRRLLVRGRYDVVHTHSPVPATAARLLAPRGSMLVHTEHNVWQRYSRPTRWANALTLSRNALVLAVSRSVLTSMWTGFLPQPPKEVLLHGVDLTRAKHGSQARVEALRRLGLSDGRPTIVTVGTMTPKKDHLTLLEAFAVVRRRVPEARLVLIGAGPLLAKLQERARSLEVDDAVVWAGLRDDVVEVLPAGDVFTMSSRHEGLSIALVEALSAGLPAVCTAVGGIPEVVTPACGVLVLPGRPDQLAEALVAMLTDPDQRERLSRGALARASAFDIHRAADVLAARYHSLAGSSMVAAEA